MNSKERYIRVLEGKEVDFLPRVPLVMQFAAEYAGYTYGKLCTDYKALVDSNLKLCKDFGIDQVNTTTDPYRETQGFDCEFEYPEDNTPHCANPPAADLDEVEEIKALKIPDPYKSERMLDTLNAIRAYKEQASEYSILAWVEGPAALAADLRGVQDFLMDLMDEDEPFADVLLDLATEVSIAFGLAQIKEGADTICVGDAIASQVSSEVYERLILPREKKMFKAFKEAGVYTRLHICGNIEHLLPGIKELGVDILDVDSLLDLKKAREVLGTDVVLAGNLDPVADVCNGTPESIRESLKKIYADVGNPLMICAGCEIPPITPKENLKAFCEEIPYVSKGEK